MNRKVFMGLAWILASVTFVAAGQPELIKWNNPYYPPFSRIAQIEGIVKADLVIDQTGKIIHTKIYAPNQKEAPGPLRAFVESQLKEFQFNAAEKEPTRYHTLVFSFVLFPDTMPDDCIGSEKIGSLFIITQKLPKPVNTIIY